MTVRRHNRVNIRKTHPNLYKLTMVFAVMSLLLAINFWTSNPTFNPFNSNKNWIGVAFFLLGAWHLIFLNLSHNLKMVRLGSTLSIFFLTAWGLGNMQQSIAGKASYQLPILYLALAGLHYLLLLEPPVNPMTELEE